MQDPFSFTPDSSSFPGKNVSVLGRDCVQWPSSQNLSPMTLRHRSPLLGNASNVDQFANFSSRCVSAQMQKTKDRILKILNKQIFYLLWIDDVTLCISHFDRRKNWFDLSYSIDDGNSATKAASIYSMCCYPSQLNLKGHSSHHDVLPVVAEERRCGGWGLLLLLGLAKPDKPDTWRHPFSPLLKPELRNGFTHSEWMWEKILPHLQYSALASSSAVSLWLSHPSCPLISSTIAASASLTLPVARRCGFLCSHNALTASSFMCSLSFISPPLSLSPESSLSTYYPCSGYANTHTHMQSPDHSIMSNQGTCSVSINLRVSVSVS